MSLKTVVLVMGGGLVAWVLYNQIASRAQAAAVPSSTGTPATGGTGGTISLYDAATAAANDAGIPPGIFRALVEQESAWNVNAHNASGATGLTQLMPATAAQMGVTNPADLYDPIINLNAGARYLASMYARYGGDGSKALAAYNAGPGTVDKGIAANPGDWLAGMANYQSAANHIQTLTYITDVESFAPFS